MATGQAARTRAQIIIIKNRQRRAKGGYCGGAHGDAGGARPGHRKILFHAVNHKGTCQTPQAINEMMAMSRKIARGVGQDDAQHSTAEQSRAEDRPTLQDSGQGESRKAEEAKHGDIVIIMPKIILRPAAHAHAATETERHRERGRQGVCVCVGAGRGVRATTVPQDMATR